ncbi:lytic transglycosylase domain-containing protein [Pseudoruegeria sp. SHC-113]|uniref:lytic transglycosylase domain-containing protein n=1 Tax=Pseudoruegeria sp. SHC-113 TaxID=2855439 RepID=UPI0021BAF089|nr:lytic transglycosylase domain-containing protein [Pseudoruegeria sp. SHC-113]
MSSLFLCAATAVGAQQLSEARVLGNAFEAMRQGDWDEATRRARAGNEVVEDLVEWHRLRAGRGEMPDYIAFLTDNSDWPGLPLLRKRGEDSIPRGASPQNVLAYFGGALPQTGVGALRLGEAQARLGNQGEAEATLVLAWRTLDLTREEREAFLERHGKLVTPHNEARLDMLLWQGEKIQAEAMYPFVSEGWRALGAARLALRDQAPGVDGLIEKVPASLADHPGLAYERFNWRARKGRNADAIALLLERSTSAAALGEPERWSGWRRALARVEMREGNAQTAYRIAANHFLTGGSAYADLEWLAGYIALRYLNDPATAYGHFSHLREEVSSPISNGRAGYWQGRALAAMGEADRAREAYAFGATYQSSFYGLLAAEAAGLPMDPALTGAEVFPDWRQASFMTSDVLHAALILHKAGELSLAERFLVHLAETQDRTALGQLGDLAFAINEPHIALMVAKQAASMGHVIDKAYYPLHELADGPMPVPPELALSIARRESEFDPAVISPVGARGLMQLMPGTAQDMAKEVGVDYSKGRLLSDWGYNAKLGTAYLNELIEEFGENYILVSVAYNAGPSRARRWIEERGDPRSAGVDIVDWIEHIPFTETRNYVMRVTEALPIYRARMSGQVGLPRLAEELNGS